ncbi:hypothetical protein BGW42_005082 [Actinomortierella wolfii]|nr:hypothetical protein BGW42_005082 [Actinomortierella wolfii]
MAWRERHQWTHLYPRITGGLSLHLLQAALQIPQWAFLEIFQLPLGIDPIDQAHHHIDTLPKPFLLEEHRTFHPHRSRPH